MKGRLLVSLILLIAASSGYVQARDLLIRNARVYTLTDQGILDNADIYIKEGKISAVGSDLPSTADSDVIEAAGKQVTPGLVNSYTHIGIVEIDLVAQTADEATLDIQFSASYAVAPAINPNSTLIPQNRINGLTYAVVAPESGHHVFAGQGAIIQLGDPDSMLINGSVAVFANYGGAAELLAGGSRAAAYAKLRQSLLDAREYAANEKAVRKGEWREFTLPLHDLAALVPVVAGGKALVVSTHRASDIRAMLTLKQEIVFKLIIAGATEAWMVADDLAAAGVPVIIDPMANVPLDFDRLGARLDAAARLHEAGVTLLFRGVDYMGTHSAYLVRQAAGNAAAYGLPPIEAIKAMTLNPATVFGFDDQSGSIVAGKSADLVIWDGDPLELLTRAETVIIGGAVMPKVSRATRLRDRYRELKSNVPSYYNR